MKKRNQSLLVVLVILLLANLSLLFSETRSSGVSFDERRFTIADTAGIRSIRITVPGKEITLDRAKPDWVLNGTDQVDEGLRRLMLSILQRVRVRRPVEVEKQEGIQVAIAGSEPLTFSVWANPTKTRTYFSQEGSEEVYEVGIPGYNDYLGAIFELETDQWKDRLVFNASWRTIQRLELRYLKDPSAGFSIRFADQFFELDGVQSLDSSAVVDYLNQFQYFEANEWVSRGRFARYDSLALTQPMATLTIETINTPDPILLDIFPALPAEKHHLVRETHGNMLVVTASRIQSILRNQADFEAPD